MELTLGARLRHQREQQQVTLAQISEITKIKLPLLEALERDNVSTWPKGLFARSYVRDYARAIGLDPESVVADFLSLYPQFAPPPPVADDELAEGELAGRPALRLRRLVSAALGPTKPRTPAHDARPLGTNAMDRGQTIAAMEDLEPIELPADVDTPAFQRRGPSLGDDHLDLSAALHDVTEPSPAPEPVHSSIDLPAFADICASLARAIDWRDVTALLSDAARVLDAAGAIVWQWDTALRAMRPSIACGYDERLIARLPPVPRDGANAVAEAFRSTSECRVEGADGSVEAIAMPVHGVDGCVGVLAVELRSTLADVDSISALIRILAAQLAMLLPSTEAADSLMSHAAAS
jgi:hypothetical protein